MGHQTHVEQVDMFVYLGSMINEDAECKKENRRRLARGHGAETGLKHFLQVTISDFKQRYG